MEGAIQRRKYPKRIARHRLARCTVRYAVPVRYPLTGESRKLDFVIKGSGKKGGGHAQEITSKTASKRSQLAKEERIRDAGGVYVRDGKSLVHIDGIFEIIRLP